MLGPRTESVTGCCTISEGLFPLGRLDKVLMAMVNPQIRTAYCRDKQGNLQWVCTHHCVQWLEEMVGPS